jgi:hypothetical protein
MSALVLRRAAVLQSGQETDRSGSGEPGPLRPGPTLPLGRGDLGEAFKPGDIVDQRFLYPV